MDTFGTELGRAIEEDLTVLGAVAFVVGDEVVLFLPAEGSELCRVLIPGVESSRLVSGMDSRQSSRASEKSAEGSGRGAGALTFGRPLRRIQPLLILL